MAAMYNPDLQMVKFDPDLQMVMFDPDLQTLSQFLERWPPSTTTNPQVSWICVRNPAADAAAADERADPEGLEIAWANLCESRNDAVSATDLNALSVQYHVLGGKWLIFSTSSSVDMDWRKVAEGVTSGLFREANVATKDPDSRNHVICVFTKNYLDLDDVKRVRQRLRQIGFTNKLLYKPDVFTYCGVYAKNKWGIRASIYSQW